MSPKTALPEEQARTLREQGKSHFQIAEALGLSLTEVRRALDTKAAETHKRWSGERRAARCHQARVRLNQFVPREPFVRWLEETIPRYPTLALFSELVGVSGRTLTRILRGEDNGEWVMFTTVDQVLTREGGTQLWELYPDLFGSDAADEEDEA